MPALTTSTGPLVAAPSAAEREVRERAAVDALRPNAIVRGAFYFSIFAIPFTQLYLPGTGDRVGVIRLAQALIVLAMLSQPRACLGMMPVALLWFLAYCGVRLAAGFWLTPEYRAEWLPSTLHWLQFSLPWVWVLSNVMRFPQFARRGLWAMIASCVVCASLHLAGIGVVEVANGIEGRTSVFGENANVVGATYALALIGMVGIGMARGTPPVQLPLLVPLIVIVGAGLAKTGSRTSALVVAMGVLILLFQGGSLGLRTRRVAMVLVVIAILAGVAWNIPTVMKRFANLDSAKIQQQEGRVRMNRVLAEMFLRHPLLGSGPDAYRVELTRRAMPYLVKDLRLISAHNLVLLLLVETGVVGFALFATGLGKSLLAAWRARTRPSGLLPLAMLLPLAIAAFVVANPSHLMVFWFAVALALAGNA